MRRNLESAAEAEKLPSLARKAAGRLAANTVAMRLYHTGIALNWELDLEQRPVDLAGVCEQVTLSLEIGPIYDVRFEDRARAWVLEKILSDPHVTIRDMSLRRRFHRLEPAETCAKGDPQGGRRRRATSTTIESPHLRAFLKGPVTRAMVEDGAAVATSDDRFERIMIRRRESDIASVEVQEMNRFPPTS